MLKIQANNKFKKMIISILMLLVTTGAALSAPFNQAVVNAANPTSADFVVEPYFEQNASAGADKDAHPDNLWFNNVKPGSEVQATILITNKSKTPRTFKISAYTASTNITGGLAYDVVKPQMDSSQKVNFRSLFKNNDVNVKVPGAETNQGQVAVSLVAKIPEGDYKGTVMGGFNVFAFDPTEKQKRSKPQSLINLLM
ncbi:WxL protein peptidoglycan domain-containing protein [Xylocopilactobacillus apicola]|uniref:WxL Interacting Protein peptidoglycan binding domain-containing protein n=1 Tax=Xylocopilactobacillus apicola TaxID=2932184 RepID=A0AAU9DM07_9LACO|nr:DUF916 domain-containing protein [Xylocopilactobacillus apicola]BDR59611.1 hypothetical protein XA3_20520 [Xylocopilactobacillus apicola]